MRALPLVVLSLALVLPSQQPGQPAQPAQPAQPDQNALSEAEKQDGFVLLFDGKTGNGWRGYRGFTFPAKGWSVEDGALKVSKDGKGGDLVTVDQFDSFDLRFSWKVTTGANSGVMYRVSEAESYPWRTGPEYQVLDDQVHQDGKSPLTSSGSLYALVAPAAKKLAAVGSWNDARIVVDGDRVEHWLNGEKVVESRLAGPEWDALVKKSKFASMPGFGKQRRGHVCLQDHGDEVAFRALRIKDLGKRPPPRALFAGKPMIGKGLAGWTAHLNDGKALADVWSVDADGVLVCQGKPNGYLRTEDSFQSFVLRVVWRWSPQTKAEGNSGVLIRMVGEDKVWPKCIEAQLHSQSAGDFWNIGDFTMKTDASRTKGRNTAKTHGAERPIGEWNEYEIVADGPTVTLKVNGQVLNVARECDETPGKICLQSEGCEIHFKEVTLRPIER